MWVTFGDSPLRPATGGHLYSLEWGWARLGFGGQGRCFTALPVPEET